MAYGYGTQKQQWSEVPVKINALVNVHGVGDQADRRRAEEAFIELVPQEPEIKLLIAAAASGGARGCGLGLLVLFRDAVIR